MERWGKDQTKLFIVKCKQTSLKSHAVEFNSLLIKILMCSCTFFTSWYQTSILKPSGCIHSNAKNKVKKILKYKHIFLKIFDLKSINLDMT